MRGGGGGVSLELLLTLSLFLRRASWPTGQEKLLMTDIFRVKGLKAYNFSGPIYSLEKKMYILAIFLEESLYHLGISGRTQKYKICVNCNALKSVDVCAYTATKLLVPKVVWNG